MKLNFFSAGLLHAEHEGGLSALLCQWFGEFGHFLDEVVLHGILDTLKLVPFLFLTYLIMELIEHHASDKARRLMQRAGSFGPILGGTLGAVPQCGFSSVGANLYTGRVITVGTLLAVFLSTSDEMLPILIAGNAEPLKILYIVLYKCGVGILVGFAADALLRVLGKPRREIDIDEMCEADGCGCGRGVLPSALHHTLSVSLFLLIVTIGINALIYFIGEDTLLKAPMDIPVLSHLIASLVGLIPNCASSVVLTKLAASGIISSGAMISGLLSGAGVGVLVLFRMNKHPKENILILLALVLSGVLFGAIADLIPALSLT